METQTNKRQPHRERRRVRDGGGEGPGVDDLHRERRMVGLLKAACAEFGEYGIRANCVSPFGWRRQ